MNTPNTQHHTPAEIRDESFQRRLLGLDTHQVYEYLDALADQVQAAEQELGDSRAENERLAAELQRLQAELDEHEQVGDRVNEQVVRLMSQAQLVAEEMVEEVTRDSRERIGQARAHERKIVEEALDTAGRSVSSYARSAQAQMESIMSSFASEVDRLGVPSASDQPVSDAAPDHGDPLFDDWSDWETTSRNGDGPGSRRSG